MKYDTRQKRIRTLTLSRLEKRQQSYISFLLDREPKSKKASIQEKKEIQKVFLNEMKKLGRLSFEKDIAIEIDINSTGKTPPQIENYVKNILDIMWKKEYLDNYADSPYLPFIDDKQIKYLRAKYSFFYDIPRIAIRIRGFHNFIKDVLFARELMGDADDSIDIANEFGELNALISKRDHLITLLSEKAYNSMIMMKKVYLQKEISKELGLTPFMISLIFPKRIKHWRINRIYHDWANQSLKMPIRIRLMEIPTIKGSGKEYKKYLENQLKQYIERYSILKEILSPLILSVYYKSPNTRNKNFFKDIDNIMRDYLVPAFNKVFSPPIMSYGIKPWNSKDERLREVQKNYPKSLHGSVIGYEIIELPTKFPEPGGFLTVGFNLTEFGKSLMDITDEVIYNYIHN